MSSSSSSDEDDNFLRLHAQAIAEALQQREASEQAFAAAAAGCGTAPSTSKSQREKLVHDTYVALCYDDPRVESDFACTCLATALLDPASPYALSGPLVEGIKQLSLKQQEQQEKANDTNTQNQATKAGNENDEEKGSKLTNATTCTSQGSAILSWTIHARIPHLLCQASTLDEVHAYLGSYRPPPPPNNALGEDKQYSQHDSVLQQQKNQDADRLAALLTQPISSENQEKSPETVSIDHETNNNTTTTTIGNLQHQQQQEDDDEVWAAESDPSDFQFESGFTYEQRMADLEQSFSEWMIDRTDPLKLSQPPSRDVTTWKHVRHAVMELTSQFTYRQVASLFGNTINNTTLQKTLTGSPSQTLSDVLARLTMTLLIPPTTSTTATSTGSSNNRPSIFDSPDDEQDFLQPQRQLQAMAWYPLWVMRDVAVAVTSSSSASSSSSSSDYFSHYLTLLQNLISIDAASRKSAAPSTSTTSSTMAPATYVGLASLSSLCQQFVVANSDHAGTGGSSSTTNNETIERFRSLRLALWETCDDLTHALEKEEGFRKAAAKQKTQDSTNDNNINNKNYWIEWTLLPFFEIITNQRLQDGTTIVAKVESIAQRHYHHQQTSQRWAGLLQSGLFRQWFVRLQALRDESLEESVVSNSDSPSSPRLLWQLMRRSLLYIVAHSMTVTTALGKYAWRYPGFGSVVEIGGSCLNRYPPSSSSDPEQGVRDVLETFTDDDVDDILWNLLSMELAGTSAASGAPTIQWKTSNPSKNSLSFIIKPLPSRVEGQQVSLKGFQRLCQHVVLVLQLACQEENKKENLSDGKDANADKVVESSSPKNSSRLEDLKIMHQLVLRNFHRLVNTIAGCPLLAKLFVHDLEETAVEEESITSISKCLDSIQEALSQYKGPPPDTLKTSQSKEKDDDDDDESKAVGFDSRRAKEQVQNAGLQEDIHMVRKVLKMLRTLQSTKATTPAGPAATATITVSLDLTSSSKTD